MGCGGKKGPGRWYHERDGKPRGTWFGGARRETTSGNHAFDEYREETLRRLEDEQEAFLSFLERLRKAKDKAEFDQFMAEHRRETPNAGSEGFAAQP